MKKSRLNDIRDIAKKLPAVKEVHASGYYLEEPEDKSLSLNKKVPYTYITEANHYRRLKRAFIKNGIDGIKQYLEYIHQLQKERNANKNKDHESRETDSLSEVPVVQESDNPNGDENKVTA